MRSGQDQVLWSIFGTFWAANAILLVALFQDGTLPRDRSVVFIIGLVGFLMSLTWDYIQNRALGHIGRHEALIAMLETELGLKPEHAVSSRINHDLYDKHLNKGPSA